jgi:hypothetical protein
MDSIDEDDALFYNTYEDVKYVKLSMNDSISLLTVMPKASIIEELKDKFKGNNLQNRFLHLCEIINRKYFFLIYIKKCHNI